MDKKIDKKSSESSSVNNPFAVRSTTKSWQIALALVILLFLVGFVVWQQFYVMRDDSVISSTDETASDEDMAKVDAIPTGTLYFSGIPDNDFNLLPNTYTLTLPDIVSERISGLTSQLAFSRGYTNHTVSGDRFMLLKTDPEKGVASPVLPVIVFPNTPHNSSQNEAIPFKQEISALDVEANMMSHALTISPGGSRLALVTHFSDFEFTEADVESGRLPNMQDFSTWTIATLTAVEDGDGIDDYIPNATNPVFANENYLLFLRSDAIYGYDFITNQAEALVTAASLDVPVFSTQDSIAIVGPEDEPQLLIYKHDTAELITVGVTATETLIVTDRTNLTSIDDRTIFQVLPLNPNVIATLHVDPTFDQPDIIALYDISTNEPELIVTYSMEGVTQSGSTEIDSFTLHHLE